MWPDFGEVTSRKGTMPQLPFRLSCVFESEGASLQMTATVSNKRQVVLPAEVCAELGIEPGVRLEFGANEGKLQAVKRPVMVRRSLKHLYTPERIAEESIIEKGCSCEVPNDFSQ